MTSKHKTPTQASILSPNYPVQAVIRKRFPTRQLQPATSTLHHRLSACIFINSRLPYPSLREQGRAGSSSHACPLRRFHQIVFDFSTPAVAANRQVRVLLPLPLFSPPRPLSAIIKVPPVEGRGKEVSRFGLAVRR